MASMTKEELKSAIINHGLSPPPASSKKEEFLAMYEEHVAPIDRDAGEFSSDDEVTLSPKKKKASQSSAKSTSSSKASKKGRKSAGAADSEATSLLVDDLNIDELEDEELFRLLKENGVDVGPIVASTRPFYKKKLALVLKGENGVANGSANGDAFSDTEPEDEDDQPSAVVSPKAETRTSTRSRLSSSSKLSNKSATQSPPPAPASEPRTGLRKRMNIADEIDSSLRNTPTPRRSIHTYKVTETIKTTEVLNKSGLQTRDTERILEKSQSSGDLSSAASSSFPWKKVLVGLMILAVLVALGLYLNKQKGAMSVDSIMDSLQESIKSAPVAAPAPPTATPKVAAPAPPPRDIPDQPAVADV